MSRAEVQNRLFTSYLGPWAAYRRRKPSKVSAMSRFGMQSAHLICLFLHPVWWGPDRFICIMICVFNTAHSVTPEQESSGSLRVKEPSSKGWKEEMFQGSSKFFKGQTPRRRFSGVCVRPWCAWRSPLRTISLMSSKQRGPVGARGRGPALAPVAPGHSVIRQVLCSVASLLTVVSFARSTQLEEKNFEANKF